MKVLIRYEPFFTGYLFAHEGDLYCVDGPIEQDNATLVVFHESHPSNGLSVPAKVQIQTLHITTPTPKMQALTH